MPDIMGRKGRTNGTARTAISWDADFMLTVKGHCQHNFYTLSLFLERAARQHMRSARKTWTCNGCGYRTSYNLVVCDWCGVDITSDHTKEKVEA